MTGMHRPMGRIVIRGCRSKPIAYIPGDEVSIARVPVYAGNDFTMLGQDTAQLPVTRTLFYLVKGRGSLRKITLFTHVSIIHDAIQISKQSDSRIFPLLKIVP